MIRIGRITDTKEMDMYGSNGGGGGLASTGLAFTVGGSTFGAPVLLGIGAMMLLVGIALLLLARRTRRGA